MTQRTTKFNVERSSHNGSLARDAGPALADEPAYDAITEREHAPDVAPRTPRWVKAFVVAFVVLALALAGLHLTGYAPTHGMPMHETPLQDMPIP